MRFLPLFEAKMFHQFDHRWATYGGVDEGVEVNVEGEEDETLDEAEDEEREGAGKTRDCTLSEKQDPNYLPTPRYWVSEAEVLLKAVPLDKDEKKELEKLSPKEIVRLLRPRAPKWLVAYRRITNATNERSTIAAICPCVGFGDPSPILRSDLTAAECLIEISILNSIVFDYGARNKIGGTHIDAFHLYQMAALAPNQVPNGEAKRVVQLALELVYTSEHLRPLAEACGYAGPPFPYDEDRRALLRGELDAIVARLYGLNRKQLRYILCPQGLSWIELQIINDDREDPTCFGPHSLPASPALDFPGETFRVLKDKEEKRYGEYRTRRLVLEAWDRLWTELGPVEPLPVRFGPNAPKSEDPVAQTRTHYSENESSPGRLFDVPVATGLFAPGSTESSVPSTLAPHQPAPSPVPVSPPTLLDDEEEEEPFDLVPPEPKLPTPVKDKDGQIIRVRVLGAAGQEIISAGTVVGQRKQGEVVEWAVLPEGSTQTRKFLSPPAVLKRLKEDE